MAPICNNCGSALHAWCCARCGRVGRRRSNRFCSRRCKRLQRAEDHAAALDELEAFAAAGELDLDDAAR
jgi:hypothetical protein